MIHDYEIYAPLEPYTRFFWGERIRHVLWHMMSYTTPEDVLRIIELLK
jgi:hypothetical protein